NLERRSCRNLSQSTDVVAPYSSHQQNEENHCQNRDPCPLREFGGQHDTHGRKRCQSTKPIDYQIPFTNVLPLALPVTDHSCLRKCEGGKCSNREKRNQAIRYPIKYPEQNS